MYTDKEKQVYDRIYSILGLTIIMGAVLLSGWLS